jgi:hypothetical protein
MVKLDERPPDRVRPERALAISTVLHTLFVSFPLPEPRSFHVEHAQTQFHPSSRLIGPLTLSTNKSVPFMLAHERAFTPADARVRPLRQKPRLLSPPLAHEFHDIGRRPAGHEAGNVVDMNPATSGYFVTWASFGAIRDFAEEHVMVFLFATEVEEVFGRLSG